MLNVFFISCRQLRLSQWPVLVLGCALLNSGQAQSKTQPQRDKHHETMTIDHIAIHVVDLKKSAAFYADVMGLEQIPEPFHDQAHVWFRIGAGAALHVVAGANVATTHDITQHMAFRVASLQSFMAKLDALHIAYRDFKGTGKFAARPDGVQQIYLQDPDGYWIEVNDAKP
jgi:lactoylglutathione lyase